MEYKMKCANCHKKLRTDFPGDRVWYIEQHPVRIGPFCSIKCKNDYQKNNLKKTETY